MDGWRIRPEDATYQTLGGLSAAARAEPRGSRTIELGSLRIDSRMTIAGLVPTRWAVEQLSHLVGAPSSFVAELPSDLASRILRYGLSDCLSPRERARRVSLRSRGGRLTAVLAADTPAVYDDDLADWTAACASRLGLRLAGAYRSDRYIHVHLVEETPALEGLHRGMTLSGSEVGAAAFASRPFLLDPPTGARIYWGFGGPVDARETARSSAIGERVRAYLGAAELPQLAAGVAKAVRAAKRLRPPPGSLRVEPAPKALLYHDGSLWEAVLAMCTSPLEVYYSDIRLRLDTSASGLMEAVDPGSRKRGRINRGDTRWK